MLGVAATGLSACATPCEPPPAPSGASSAPALIDGHCHLFNASDLSTVRFLSWIVCKRYPAQATHGPRLEGVEDPDDVDGLMQALLDVLGADAAPTARQELAVLEGGARLDRLSAPKALDLAADRERSIGRLATLLDGKVFRPTNAAGEARLRAVVLQSAGLSGSALTERGRPDSAALARRAVTPAGRYAGTARAAVAGSDIYLPGVVDFIAQLKRYRHCEVDALTAIHVQDGQSPQLLAPAMVDFGRWLRDDPDKGSTFVEQAAVWPAISRRKGGPAVHGYVAFCPLRLAQFSLGRFTGPDRIPTACDADPREVVKAAVLQQGFLGVKLYPPMGFRAWNNASRGAGDHPFPVDILADTFGEAVPSAQEAVRSRELGEALDAALDWLYGFCVDHDIPIMAHGGNSVGANRDTGELADPYYWRPVLDRARPPRVMLAHFGGFDYRSADPNAPQRLADLGTRWARRAEAPPPANTWEAWDARYLEADAAKPLFLDLSYFSEALKGEPADVARRFDALTPRQRAILREHLVFGTDWVMLAQEKGVPRYSSTVRAVVTAAFGADALPAVMRGNYLRFTGLAPGNATFERMARVYRGDPWLRNRLTAACAP
jgi:hypothetical protein